MVRRAVLLLALAFMASPPPVMAQDSRSSSPPTGSLGGRAVDGETHMPLANVRVSAPGSNFGSLTDEEGGFTLEGVPVGTYSIRFELIGYATTVRTDVVVKSGRITFVNAELPTEAVTLEGVVVHADRYFKAPADGATSSISFDAEEIRRAPGSAGDVSRILMGLPSIAKVDDLSNGLIVRGGSPMENGFYVDNIEIPNINHFPAQGSSAGPIGLLNVDMIESVEFQAGGFSAAYGDRLSSIMDVRLREGNRVEQDVQLDLSFAGFGGVAEGPLNEGKGSWVFSARRSYLDLIVDAIGTGTEIVPQYSDYQGKLAYDIGGNHHLTALGLVGDDHIRFDRAAAVDNDDIVYGGNDISEVTGGVNWRALWSGRLFSNTSLAFVRTSFEEDFHEVTSQSQLTHKNSVERTLSLRNVNHATLGSGVRLRFGIEAKWVSADFDNRFFEYTDAHGDPVPPLTMNEDISAEKFAGFASLSLRPIPRLTATLGVRGEHFSYTDREKLSPRLALSYDLGPGTRLNLSGGVYRQTMPLILLAQHESNRDLKDPKAIHYVAGVEHLLTEDTRLTLEAYRKDYRHFPVDPAQPELFLVDELYYRYGFFFNHGELTDAGEARSHGVEATVQKKLASGVYGLASGSYFRTKYRNDEGDWTDRVFDNRWLASVEGGYKPNSRWEFSVRWIYAGGAPYTPLDLEASAAIDRDVLDRDRINAERYPDYHSLNVRFDRRFHFRGSNLTWYVSVWNAYGRENVSSYYWNANADEVETVTGWGTLPIFGLEYEF